MKPPALFSNSTNVRRTNPPPMPGVAAARSIANSLRSTGDVDVPLLAAALLLVAFGVVMVYSSSAVFAARMHGSAQYFLVRQSIFAIVGLVAMGAISRIDYRVLRKLTYPLLALTV